MIAALIVALLLGPTACPAPPVQAPVVVPYRAPACRYCAGHRGLEYSTVPGTPVTAVAGGVVTFAESVAGTRYVVVRQTDGLLASYGMLGEIDVEAGQTVDTGAVVGTTGRRLYFGWRRVTVVSEGSTVEVPVDPTPLLGRWAANRRLLPRGGGVARWSPTPTAGRALRLVCPANPGGATERVGR